QNHAAEAAKLPGDAQIQLRISEQNPLVTKSNGWGRVDIYVDFLPWDQNAKPLDKKIYTVVGGELITDFGPIQKTARFESWDFVPWKDASQPPRWGHSLTHGEVILPDNSFSISPNDMTCDNYFEIERFGSNSVLLRMDRSRGHRLTWFKLGRLQI